MCSALLKALLLCPHTDHSATACLKYGDTDTAAALKYPEMKNNRVYLLSIRLYLNNLGILFFV